jgi:PKD repeat protein
MSKNYSPLLVAFLLINLAFVACLPNEELVKPSACFTFSPETNIEVGQSISFQNCSKDGKTYAWDFGDGANSSVSEPTHTYNQPGEYEVVLEVYNNSLKDITSHIITVIDPEPVACFSISQNPVDVNQFVTFDNCSQNAGLYHWDFNSDGITDSEETSPSMRFENEGIYNVKLTAINGNLSNFVTLPLLVGTNLYDPTVYDMPIQWNDYYFNEFETKGDWSEESNSEYTTVIEDNHYKLTNFLTENLYLFWTNVVGMPQTTTNYDMEALVLIEYDVSTEGDGIFWALDPDAFNYNYYRYSQYEGIDYYIIGDSKTGSWLQPNDWSSTNQVNFETYNKLTVRKFFGKYYVFMNEQYLGTYDYTGDFGEKFGFIVGADSKMWVDWVGIWEMNFNASKAAKPKSFLSNSKQATPVGNHVLKITTPAERIK